MGMLGVSRSRTHVTGQQLTLRERAARRRFSKTSRTKSLTGAEWLCTFGHISISDAEEIPVFPLLARHRIGHAPALSSVIQEADQHE